MVKFLVIRFSSIGDIVLTTPVIRLLKSQVGDAEIHFLTKKQYALYRDTIDDITGSGGDEPDTSPQNIAPESGIE